jgi:Xaa-Pro aminopeptidase
MPFAGTSKNDCLGDMFMLKNRLAAARTYLDKHCVDALLLLNLGNIRYLSGFTGSDGALIVFRDEVCFLTDSRYSFQASNEVSSFRRLIYQEKGPAISSTLSGKGARRVGFEAEAMTVATRDTLAGLMPDVELVPISAELNNLRIVKDAEELLHIGRAAEIASGSLLGILDKVRPDTTERDIAFELEFAMLKAGADDKAFDIIVASGERGALPHGKASEKKVLSGELVTIDFGAVYKGYNSDETVTVSVGEPDKRQREIYQIVKDAHDLALEFLRPGVTCKEIDAKARDHIEGKGLGRYFGHGLGHGVGIDIHEKPVISFRSETVVEEGMVFTIEPGIYLPGWGGVRIEDTVCVTGDGCRVMTKVCKDLLVL